MVKNLDTKRLAFIGLTIFSVSLGEGASTHLQTPDETNRAYKANSQTRPTWYTEGPPGTIGEVIIDNKEGVRRCTGLATSNTVITTANHCISEDTLMGKFRPWNWETDHLAWVISRDSDKDLAELRLSQPLDLTEDAIIPAGQAEAGSQGVVFGFCKDHPVSPGIVVKKAFSDGPMIVRDTKGGDRLTDAALWIPEQGQEKVCPGDSGAPVLQKKADRWINVGMVVNVNSTGAIVIPSVEER